MKIVYKGCEIEVTRDKYTLFFSVFDDGFEVTSGFSEASDTVRDFMNDLKKVVDDYRENPEEYE